MIYKIEDLKKEIKDKNVLITGGLGLIGSTLANKLVKLNANITILDSELERYGSNKFNIINIKNKITFIKEDIRNKEMIRSIIKDKGIIFNLAAQVDYNYSLENPFLDLDINCKGHLNILESCRKFNPKVKIIFSGSRMEYGKIKENPVNEEQPTNPLSVYGVHKLTGEKYYQAYFNHYGIKSVCFRITNPYGPRSQMKHHNYSILNWFIRQAMESKEITIFGEGKQIRDYIFVEDLAEAMILASVSNNTNGKIYNLGSGQPTKFIDMAKMVIKNVGSGTLNKKAWPKSWKHVETGDFYADISKLKRDLDWEAKTALNEGIKKTTNYYKKYKKYYW